jgi:hypothetical protein
MTWRYAIRHDLIRKVVYGSILPARRRRLHARHAAARAERSPDSVALAEHWVAAGDLDRALPAAWRAADAAGRQNAYDEQLHLLDLILTHWSEVEHSRRHRSCRPRSSMSFSARQTPGVDPSRIGGYSC